MCVASVEPIAPWIPARLNSWPCNFAISASNGAFTYFSNKNVLPHFMKVWKNYRWFSRLIAVCSSKSSKVQPLPRYLRLPSRSNSISVDFFLTQSLDIHLLNMLSHESIPTNSKNEWIGYLKRRQNILWLWMLVIGCAIYLKYQNVSLGSSLCSTPSIFFRSIGIDFTLRLHTLGGVSHILYRFLDVLVLDIMWHINWSIILICCFAQSRM